MFKSLLRADAASFVRGFLGAVQCHQIWPAKPSEAVNGCSTIGRPHSQSRRILVIDRIHTESLIQQHHHWGDHRCKQNHS